MENRSVDAKNTHTKMKIKRILRCNLIMVILLEGVFGAEQQCQEIFVF